MSNQLPPPRPWIRLGSVTRPAISPTLAALQASPVPVPSPPSPTTPLLRPSLPLPTSVRQVAAESSPRLPLLGRSPFMNLTATRSQQPKEPTPPQNATSPAPAPVLGIPSKLIPPASTTGSLAQISAIQKPAAPREAYPSDVKPLNQTPPYKTVPSASLSPPLLLPSQIKVPEEDVPPSEADRKNTFFQKITTVPKQLPGNVGMIRPSGVHSTGTAAAVEKGPINGAADIVKKKPETRQNSIEVITIAGENRGATMELMGGVMKYQEKIGNGFSNSYDRNNKGNAAAMRFPRVAVCVNSNVQGVNNLILYNSYCEHRDPGVHMTLTRKPDDASYIRIKDQRLDS